MDVLLEIILNLIIDGYSEAASDRKVPLAVRVIVAILLIAVYGGLIGFCFYLGIHDRNWIAVAIGVLILFVTVPAIIRYLKKIRSSNADKEMRKEPICDEKKQDIVCGCSGDRNGDVLNGMGRESTCGSR